MAESPGAKGVAAAVTGFAVAIGSAVLRRWARKEWPARPRVIQATRVGDWFRSNGYCAPAQFELNNPLVVSIQKVRKFSA
jgi:hypothetical protein